MAKRKARPLPNDWEERETAVVNGRTLTRGTEVTIRGERGRFRFLKAVERPERGLAWLDFWGGPKGSEHWRSFRADRVKRVHRINTTGANLLKARKAA